MYCLDDRAFGLMVRSSYRLGVHRTTPTCQASSCDLFSIFFEEYLGSSLYHVDLVQQSISSLYDLEVDIHSMASKKPKTLQELSILRARAVKSIM
jgi:hypothetical protein